MANDTSKRRVIITQSEHGADSSMPRTMVSPHIADTLKTPQVECINDRELISINALLAYVSYNQNVQQETVQMIVESEFGIDSIAHLRRDDYMRVVEFLVDLKMDEVIN